MAEIPSVAVEVNAKRPPESPVQEAFGTLSSRMSDLEVAILHLINKIEPALSPDIDGRSDAPSAPAVIMAASDVRNAVDSQINRVTEMYDLINRVTTRIEL